MPTANKQSPKPTKARRNTDGTLLDRITPVDDMEVGGLSFNIYGRTKTGKTRFAATFPKPLLFLGFEDGMKSVRGVKGVDYVRLRGSEDVYEAVEYLKQGKYKSTALDTGTGLQDVVLAEILGVEQLPAQQSWGLASQQQWGQCSLQTKERLRALLGLTETHNVNVIVIAQERNFNDESDHADLLFPSVGSALSPKVTGWLNSACDYICQTYIREGVSTKNMKVGDLDVPMTEKTGKLEYCLRVAPHPVYMTGFRLPPGSKELPEAVVNPDYNKVLKLIQGG